MAGLVWLMMALPALADFQAGWEAYQHGDYRTAFTEWKAGADVGYAPSQFRLATLYESGKGIEKNYGLAVEWYRRSASLGYAPAFYGLALLTKDGKGIERNTAVAIDLLRRAADLGYSPAKIVLGQMYAKGDGIDRDHEKALELFEEAAADRSDERISGLAKNLLLSVRLLESFDSAGGQQSIPSHLNDGEPLTAGAFNVLGDAHYDGFWVTTDHDLATRLFERAAKLGHAKAAFRAGQSYEYGEGVEADFSLAVAYYELAAEQGVPEAHYRLGIARLYGSGVEKNHPSAYRHFNMAAEQGICDAKILVAEINVLRDQGWKAVELIEMVDDGTALRYLLDAVAEGYPRAHWLLGLVYQGGGIGAIEDKSKGLKYLLKAADEGLSAAQHGVGIAYLNGIGTEVDLTLSAEYFRRAAKQGLHASQRNLPLVLTRDADAETDYVEVLKWLHVAHDGETSPADLQSLKENIDRLTDLLSQSEVERAMQSVAETLDMISKGQADREVVSRDRTAFGHRTQSC